MKPLILMDLDGPLNPFMAENLDNFEIVNAPYALWRLSSVHGNWLRDLYSLGALTWATTWENDANEFAGRFYGLPDLPYVEFPIMHNTTTWKLPTIQKYVGSREFIWVDDELHEDAFTWANEHTARSLLIKVDDAVGWTQDQFCQMKDFLMSS